MMDVEYVFEHLQIGQIVFDMQNKRKSNAGQNHSHQSDKRFSFKSAN